MRDDVPAYGCWVSVEGAAFMGEVAGGAGAVASCDPVFIERCVIEKGVRVLYPAEPERGNWGASWLRAFVAGWQ